MTTIGFRVKAKKYRSFLTLEQRKVRTAWLYLIPMLIALAFVAGWPLLRTIILSFTDADLSDIGAAHFTGIENYILLFQDSMWWRAVWNTIFFTFTSVFFELILGTIIALTLNAQFKGRGWLRAAILIPWAIPTIVSAKMWGWMFHDIYGVINDMLLNIGFISEPVAWTANPDIAMASIIIVDVWKTTPFMALLILSGLQIVPKDCYEAAKVDGISAVKTFFKITLPLIKPILIVAILFRSLDALRVFDLIYVLTNSSESTVSMAVYARQYMIEFQEVGFGSAASVMLFVIIMALTIGFCWLSNKKADEKL